MEKLCTAAYSGGQMKRRILTASVMLMAIFLGDVCVAKGHVLIYTKNGKGFLHDNIAASVECLKKICEVNGWTYEATDSAAVFDAADKINTFDVLVFSNTNNETFDNESQRKVFQDYIRGGGGFVGIHSTCGSERNWPWFWANLGGKFFRHPPLQKFDIEVIDKTHPSTEHLPAIWKWEDEFYYINELNPHVNILLAGDLRTLNDDKKEVYPGRVFGDYFPLCWSQEFDGGFQWYTALGHKIGYYKDDNFVKHLEGGIRWVMSKTAAAKKNASPEKK
jgi:type 1 glutamine amidotransferase